MAKMVPYSLSPYGTGDIKTGSPTITITSGVGVLSVAQTGNIGVGCCIEYDDPTIYSYIAPNRLGFDSGGTTELKVGDKIQGGTSGATGVIRAIEVDSGTWAGGDAAGYIYFSKISGTWQNNEQINRIKPTTSANIATADGTLEGNIGNGNTQFVVKQADGTDAANTVGAETVDSIHHEYASLSAFEAGFTDANHINDTDLINADVVAYGCCYYDHIGSPGDADTTAVTIDWGGTTSATYYLQIFTPIGESESINNQRHLGKYNTNFYNMYITGTNSGIYTFERYCRYTGLQIKINPTTTYKRCIRIDVTDTDITWISYCILIPLGSYTGTGGIFILDANVGANIFNNSIYDATATSAFGIRTYAASNCYAHNNTIHNCTIGILSDTGANLRLKNNIVNDCADSFSGTFHASSTHNVQDQSAQEGAFGATHTSGTADGTAANKLIDSGGDLSLCSVGCIVENTTDTTYTYVTAIDNDTQLSLNDDIFISGEDYKIYTNMYGSVTFKNEGGDDFHLAHNDTVAKNKGTDLSSDANLPIWNDIDRQGRG